MVDGERGRLVVKRDKKRKDRYRGTANVRAQGVKGKLAVDFKVHTPERMTSTNTLSVRIRGQRCTILRSFDSEYLGP